MKIGKPKKHYKDKEKRIKKFFAWYPVFANGQIRWFEKVKLLQEYYVDWWDGDHHFINIKFL